MEIISGIDDSLSEEAFLKAIEIRVASMLESDPELLMSYLYRLDILEDKIKAVLSTESVMAPIEGISRLILERQKERLLSKQKYNQEPIDGWEW